MDDDLTKALVADSTGEIFELDGYAAVGMAGEHCMPLTVRGSGNMPFGSELMFLPQRKPLLYNLRTRRIECLDKNPYRPAEDIFPVSAFNSPGYVVSQICGYQERCNASCLPLFSYGAVGWYRGKFRAAVVRIDRERRQDLRLMPQKGVVDGVKRMRSKFPQNRLRRHLEKCALEYGCPAGKNFFLGRREAPLPTATTCNARCLGCLSMQSGGEIACSQERIRFTPSPEEIAEIALEHMGRVKRSVVSFGQGCEGDPLMSAATIEPALRLIRSQTHKGTINMNTNGSLPDVLRRLFATGLDSIRISINSVRKPCYLAYFRPRGYRFEDILKSIRLALEHNRHVALNYLNLPGVTDSPQEVKALDAFLQRYPVHQIQWRNLNYDPKRYYKSMHRAAPQGRPMGVKKMLERFKAKYPEISNGYFNPPKEQWTFYCSTIKGKL